MGRMQVILSIVLVIFICFASVQAGSDESGSGSSNESGSGSKKQRNNIPPTPHAALPPYGYQFYNHPVYMPQGPPTPYGGYYPPATQYFYGYPSPNQQFIPIPSGPNVYPYGGYYNQPPPQRHQFSLLQIPGENGQASQNFPSIPGGSSVINHSLTVDKEYRENGHHVKTN